MLSPRSSTPDTIVRAASVAALSEPADLALLRVGEWLKATGYRFVTGTPATHALVNSRAGAAKASSLEDVFGWSRPFALSLLPEYVLAWMREADVLESVSEHTALTRSRVRYSTLDDELFVHSAFPTMAADAVFFGPDTYRFAHLIRSVIGRHPEMARGRIIDVGCGAGPGGIVAYRAAQGPATLLLTDINATALRYATINAALSGTPALVIRSDLFASTGEPVDLIVSNPPYLRDPAARLYRHGGGTFGAELSLRIVSESLSVLRPGGTLILYTGSCIVHGQDLLLAAVRELLVKAPVTYTYTELDPDVFGEELVLPGYQEVDRIAVVSLVMTVCPDSRMPSAGSLSILSVG